MADSHGCSKNTVIRAYAALEQERLIYAVPKSGHYAVSRPAHTGEASSVAFDFASAVPDPEVMPVASFHQCLNQAIELYQDRLFAYSDPQGFPSLREALSKHWATRQIFASARHICILSGAQQALHLLAEMPFPGQGDTVLVEQPTFAGMLRTLQLLNVPTVGIGRTREGIDLDELEAQFRSGRIKFFYTVPRFHNPLGCSLSQHHKRHIAELAERYGVYVVEDDYLADLETNPKADPIYAYDRSGHVIYVKSFSKVMLPGLRLAAAILPDELLARFRKLKSSSDSSTAALSQAALELYLESGLFDRHVKLMQERYAIRMEALKNAAGALGEELKLSAPSGGLFAQMTLPAGIDAVELASRLKAKGVTVMPTDGCYLPGSVPPAASGLRIGIIRVHEKRIAEGLLLIREEVEQMLRQRRQLLGAAIHWI